MSTTDAVVPPDVPVRLAELASRWRDNSANEMASLQTYLAELCRALGVAPPSAPTDEYRFEKPVTLLDRDGRESPGRIDLYKAGHFVLEGKASGEERSRDELLRRAYGQVRQYAANVSSPPPPFLMVLDVGRVLMVWDAFSGTYGGFGAGRRILLPSLHERPDDIALLRDIWQRPGARDPRGKAQAVTQDLAGRLARLAALLETRGFEQERVSRFLMRVVFCCFAEDIDLLPNQVFRRTLEAAAKSGDAGHLQQALTSLWRTMDTGGLFGAEILQRFNGHFFQSVEALPLQPEDAALLLEAAKADWSGVEPTIFGTLLVRALDPVERHRLGAEYTPRAYIERLIEPTVLEPIRERWTAVQAEVIQLEQAAAGKARPKKADARTDPMRPARERLSAFHEWLCQLRFLDPACGSGNFLYVTMAAVKRIELEVFREMERLGDQRDLMAREVHPRQFHGIEVKWWAREIAELTLWIGYHQFWRETHGGRLPPDPILEDTGTIECRDAVLAWDAIVHRPEKDAFDPTPRLTHPVTGELVPDPEARVPYYEYVNARAAEWPEADFIVGNPPYLGNKRMREALGDGYVEALRGAYANAPDSIDFVMYWWLRAADAVRSGATRRAGLITTNSISQSSNRSIVEWAMSQQVRTIWVAPNHPWVDDDEGAAVRVALTVIALEPKGSVRLASVDGQGTLNVVRREGSFNADLTMGADVAAAACTPLLSNAGIAYRGFTIVGAGFLLKDDEAAELLKDSSNRAIVRPYLNGRDLAQRTRGLYVIDFAMRTEAEARQWPRLFDIVRDRVKPGRDAMRRESRRKNWWRFGEPGPALRDSMAALSSVIVTPYVSKHRFFSVIDSAVAPDDKVVVVASTDPWMIGVLSSTIHQHWALAAGTLLEDRPTYNNTTCFNAFPFPVTAQPATQVVRDIASRILRQRREAISKDDSVSMTDIYNIVAKLRSGALLSVAERSAHEQGAFGTLLDLHDELDAVVAAAYGWQWPLSRDEVLERLVALHDERVAEERRGLVRWLRPDYQIPRFGQGLPTQTDADFGDAETPDIAPATAQPWPDTVVAQLTAINALLSRGPRTTAQVAEAFANARADLVERHLETLAMMGEAVRRTDGTYALTRRAA